MLQIPLQKTVPSLCPICLKVVQASIVSDDDRVFMEKQCEEHGRFRELYWSDLSLYRKFNAFLCDSQNGNRPGEKDSKDGCPFDCGLCQKHLTSTLLGNIDITNQCNMRCPICFADAGGRIYEPDLNQIRAMMQILRAEKPVACPAVQFSGGEPTLRKDLHQIVAMAREMGFVQIQVATNGLCLAESPELCRSLERSGLNTVYLQFDGVTPEPYRTIRGRDILPAKLKALENFREAGMTSTVLVPTLARDVNDHQVGDIVRFASKNLDVVKGINFQPISFSGRTEEHVREEKRITIPDLLALLEEQTAGEISRKDFYPVPFVAPITRLLEARARTPQPAFSVHPCCGAATYIYSFSGRLIPITRFIDVEGLLEEIVSASEELGGSRWRDLKLKGRILRELPKFVDETRAPGDLNITRMLLCVLRNGTRESLTEFHSKMLFLGAMHFQDLYNIDLERLQRCGVHYATPDGRIIPFCSYNNFYRKEVEDKFCLPIVA